MPNIKSAKKRTKQAEERRVHNKHIRTGMRTNVKSVISAIEAGDKEAANAAYKTAVAKIDASVSKGILTINKAARHKSRLNKQIKAL